MPNPRHTHHTISPDQIDTAASMMARTGAVASAAWAGADRARAATASRVFSIGGILGKKASGT